MKKMIISLVLAVVCFGAVAGGNYWLEQRENERIEQELAESMKEHEEKMKIAFECVANLVGTALSQNTSTNNSN